MLFVMLVVPFSHQDLTEKLGMDTFPNKDNSVEQPNLDESNVMEPYSRPCNPTLHLTEHPLACTSPASFCPKREVDGQVEVGGIHRPATVMGFHWQTINTSSVELHRIPRGMRWWD